MSGWSKLLIRATPYCSHIKFSMDLYFLMDAQLQKQIYVVVGIWCDDKEPWLYFDCIAGDGEKFTLVVIKSKVSRPGGCKIDDEGNSSEDACHIQRCSKQCVDIDRTLKWLITLNTCKVTIGPKWYIKMYPKIPYWWQVKFTANVPEIMKIKIHWVHTTGWNVQSFWCMYKWYLKSY